MSMRWVISLNRKMEDTVSWRSLWEQLWVFPSFRLKKNSLWPNSVWTFSYSLKWVIAPKGLGQGKIHPFDLTRLSNTDMGPSIKSKKWKEGEFRNAIQNSVMRTQWRAVKQCLVEIVPLYARYNYQGLDEEHPSYGCMCGVPKRNEKRGESGREKGMVGSMWQRKVGFKREMSKGVQLDIVNSVTGQISLLSNWIGDFWKHKIHHDPIFHFLIFSLSVISELGIGFERQLKIIGILSLKGQCIPHPSWGTGK